MDLSIIIINYNTNLYTIECIKSIYDETKKLNFEIIVIDNNSQKEDPIEIKQKFSDIKLIKNNENVGFGIANNLGIKIAKGKYLLLLNSDTIILNNALEKSINFMNSDFAITNNIGLMGCTLLNEDKTYQYSTFGEGNISGYFINSNPILSKLFRNSSNSSFDFQKPQFVTGVSGAFMLFRRDVFDKIKPFDPDIFMYSEETELCRNRVSKYFNSFYWPGTQVVHYGGKSGLSKNMHRQNMLSYALTWYKKGYFFYILYLLISIFHFTTNIVLYPFVKNQSKRAYLNNIWGFLNNFRYLIYDIPKYKKEWGARPSPLKITSPN